MTKPIRFISLVVATALPLFLTGCHDLPSARTAEDQCTPTAGFDGIAVQQRVRPSVVRIMTSAGTGSGFVVEGPNGTQLVVTNHHVVFAGEEPRIFVEGGGSVAAQVVKAHADLDLALLAPSAPLAAPAVHLSAARPVEGQSVAVVGFPGVAGSSPTLTFEPGTVTQSRRQLGARTFLQTNANVNPGNSGGPMVDGCASVVAVTTARHSSTERTGLGVPVERVGALLDAYAAPAKEPSLRARTVLERFFHDVTYREADRAAGAISRRLLNDGLLPELAAVAARGAVTIGVVEAELAKHGRSLRDLTDDELKHVGALVPQDELAAVLLVRKVKSGELDTYSAAQQFLASWIGDVFGEFESLAVDSLEAGPDGEFTASIVAETRNGRRRYRAKLAEEWGDYRITSLAKLR